MRNSIRATLCSMSLPLAAAWLVSLVPDSARAGDAASATGAAGPEAPATATGGAAPQLQEVVVTATRREEELSKVPISVTALTQDAIDSRGIKDFRDMVRFTPGVTIDDSGTNAISIRGISSSGGAGTTGIYIDDTPIQMRSVGFNPDDTLPKTFDLQRVEVLRGPQGTLFGAGAEGGAVRYIMTPASLTAADDYIRSELSYTEHGQPNGEFGVAVGRPLVDGVFGIRASLWYRYDGGWINRVDPGTGAIIDDNINYSHSYLARLAATWQPATSVTIAPSFLYQKQDRHDEPTYWPAYSNPDQGQFNTATPERIGGPDDYYLGALKVQWDLGKSQVIGNASYYYRRQLTAYQGTVYDLSYWNTIPSGLGGPNDSFPQSPKCSAPDDATSCSWFPLIDSSGIHLPAALRGTQTPNAMTNHQKSYTAELRWQSADTSSRWTWTAGVFWQEAKEGSIEELKSTNIDQVFNYLYGLSPADYYSPDGVTPANFYSCPTNAAYPVIPACDIYYNNNTTIDKQFAGYGEVSYAFTDWMRLTVGERIAHTTFELTHYADGYENYGPQPTQASQSETPNTPKAVLSFQVDPRNLYYLSYAKGFRVGGGNAPLPQYCDADLAAAGYPNGAPLTYQSDYTQNYEIGAKNGVADWLRVATSVYYIKWHNIQQNLYVAGYCGLQFTDNLGTAVAKGFDLQAQMLFGPVAIDLATAYTSARYTKNSPSDCTPGSSGIGIPCKAVDGDAITGQEGINYAPGTTPPWTVSVGVQYNFHLAARDTFVRADWQYESRNNWLANVQDPNAGAVYNFGYSYAYPSNSFASLRAGMSFGDVQLTAFCDNLLDSHTTTNYILGQTDGSFPPQQNVYTFRPRTFGVNLVWRSGGAGH
ncbi:MAG TPA: TonB-dependent receptor [Steroidobacteraceae bacterium]|nr:TonB-dependent receptor [Steroidobacteraceae bacterium]